MDLPWLDKVVRAKRPARLPEVLRRSEVNAVLAWMEGAHGWWRRCGTAWACALSAGCAGAEVSECGRGVVSPLDAV